MRPAPKIVTLLLVASLTITSSVAYASPRRVESDRTDNVFGFSYDATEGEIESASSSVRIERGDPVTFLIYIRDNPGSDEVGGRLRARLSLALKKERARRYQGRFWFEISDATGRVVYTDAVDRDVTLRPRKGRRGSAVSFDFDLLSGDYSAKGFFEAQG
jgi:hypothetical protein